MDIVFNNNEQSCCNGDVALQEDASYTGHATNESVLQQIGEKQELLQTISRRQIAFTGHVIRKGRLEELCLSGRVQGKKATGGQKLLYLNQLKESTGQCAIRDLWDANLALNKPAWMSSVYARASVSSAAENSVDCHLGTNWFHGVCSSTAENDRSPWIVIDLLGQYEVHNVTIYNREDDFSERLHDFVIEIYRTNPSRCSEASAVICKVYSGVFGLTGNVQCESAVLGRFVRIWKPTTLNYQDVLTVCEIEVYGIRPDSCAPTWHQGVRGKYLLSPGAATFPQQSMVTCFHLCVMSETCVGANYNGGSNECQLISQPKPTDTVSSNQDWVFFGDDLC
ncbi:uncharacterized protein [Haliotis asinina]|uniref:uncharacterized protein n=1 Tax=Haliotis asinina TaxID=109174 RepID=UPI0035319675